MAAKKTKAAKTKAARDVVMKLTEMTEAQLVAAKGVEDGLVSRTRGAARMKHRGKALAIQRQIDRLRGVRGKMKPVKTPAKAPTKTKAPARPALGTVCHHCKKPIESEPVIFQSEGQTPRHYHEEHAVHALPKPSERPEHVGEKDAEHEKHGELVRGGWRARTAGGVTTYLPPGGGAALALDEAYEKMLRDGEDDWLENF